VITDTAYPRLARARAARFPVALARYPRSGCASLLAIAPRSAFSYPLYVLAAITIVDFRRARIASWAQLALVTSGALTALLLAPTSERPSTGAFVLELALMSSTLLFACGFSVSGDLESLLPLLRWTNLVLFVVDLVHVAQRGLPYLSGLPDMLNGLYGSGGARIVTALGFFGLLQEWGLARRGGRWSRRAAAFALINFLAPSYVIAILSGLLSLALWYATSPKRLLALVATAAPSLWYALVHRLGELNGMATSLMGESPKHFAYASVWRMYDQHPLLAFLGAGAGQFSSIPQTWVDPGIRAVSRQSVAHFPGLAASGFHSIYVSPYTQLGLSHPYAISSAANKPYTGISTLLAEWGLLGIVILVLIIRRAGVVARVNSMMWPALTFFLFTNLVDDWQDSPWMGLGLLVIAGVADARSTSLKGCPPPQGES
jgi:hypothetical protein